MNAICDADAPIEANQIRTATEQHVLAVIDNFVDAWVQIRRCAPTEIASTLDELHAVAGLGQRTSRTHPGDAATDDSDGARSASRIVWRDVQPHLLRKENDRAAMMNNAIVVYKPNPTVSPIPFATFPTRGYRPFASLAHWLDAKRHRSPQLEFA